MDINQLRYVYQAFFFLLAREHDMEYGYFRAVACLHYCLCCVPCILCDREFDWETLSIVSMKQM